MKRWIIRILKLITGRVARNILLWVMVVYFISGNDTENYIYPAAVYHRLIPLVVSLVLALTCMNNFWLAPAYLRKKRLKIYLPAVIGFTVLISLLQVLLLKGIRMQYPGLETHHISLITSPVSASWKGWDILEEVGWYTIGFALWLLLMNMAWYSNEYFRKEKEMSTYRQKQVETELSFLKNQVNPHFLFNTLNNLYGLALKKSDDTADAVMKLSSIMRYLIYETNHELISSEKEKETMQAYIDLELLRITDRENIHFSIEADGEYMVPGLLWLPILENAFKYGTRIISQQLFIDYKYVIANNTLTIHSVNFYKPGTELGKEEHSGIGLTNLRKRLEMVYPGRHSLEINKEDSRFSIALTVQLQ